MVQAPSLYSSRGQVFNPVSGIEVYHRSLFISKRTLAGLVYMSAYYEIVTFINSNIRRGFFKIANKFHRTFYAVFYFLERDIRPRPIFWDIQFTMLLMIINVS